MKLAYLTTSEFTLPIFKNILKSQDKPLLEIVIEQIANLPAGIYPEFWNKPELVLRDLEEILETKEKIDLSLLVTQPQRENRGKPVAHPVLEFARKNQINTFTPQSLNKELSKDNFDSYDFDLGITASYGQIIAERVLNLPKYGFINWHPSLLPQYRGATPMQSVLRDGKEVTGLTWITMTKGMDEGNILLQQSCSVKAKQKFVELSETMGKLGASTWSLAVATQLLIKSGNAKYYQEQVGKPTLCSLLNKDDALVDPQNQTASQIFNHFRAYHTWPKTSFESDYFNEKVRIDKCELPFEGGLSKGLITYENDEWIQTKDSVFLKCVDQTLLPIRSLTRANGKKLDFSGYRFG
jgi:methionyl-tRNA formyltransferase